jgi:hypothetical protein
MTMEEGLSHHYRICEYGGFECLKKDSQVDTVAHKWGSKLVKSVATACELIFDGDTCPEAPPLGSPW